MNAVRGRSQRIECLKMNACPGSSAGAGPPSIATRSLGERNRVRIFIHPLARKGKLQWNWWQSAAARRRDNIVRSTPCILAPFHSNLRRQTGSAHESIMAGGGCALASCGYCGADPSPDVCRRAASGLPTTTRVERRWTDRRTGAGRDRERALIKLAQLKMENRAWRTCQPFLSVTAVR